MLIDKNNFHSKHSDDELREALQIQVAMWSYESHCWVVQPDGHFRCSWCSKERIGNFSPAKDKDQRSYPLCDLNPVLEEYIRVLSLDFF